MNDFTDKLDILGSNLANGYVRKFNNEYELQLYINKDFSKLQLCISKERTHNLCLTSNKEFVLEEKEFIISNIENIFDKSLYELDFYSSYVIINFKQDERI